MTPQVLPYDEAGTGPAVVLVHAGVADRTMWEEHLAPLAAAGRRAIAVDLPGFGEAPVGEVSAPWLDLLETMDGLGLDSAALVGSSFGGAVALRTAVMAPDRVAALALVSAPGPDSRPSPELEAAWQAEEEALERGDVEAAVSAVVETWTLPDAPRALRERVAAMQRRAFEVQMAAGEVSEAADPLGATFPRLPMPTLIAVGEFDKPDFHAGARAIARDTGAGEPVVIAGAGHLAPLEQPPAFQRLLLEFLDEAVPGPDRSP